MLDDEFLGEDLSFGGDDANEIQAVFKAVDGDFGSILTLIHLAACEVVDGRQSAFKVAFHVECLTDRVRIDRQNL